jgi:hypothetical protein
MLVPPNSVGFEVGVVVAAIFGLVVVQCILSLL